MSKNKLGNLNDLLMQTLQNIVDPEVDADNNIINEITSEKASAVAKIGQVMVNNAKVQLDAFKLVKDGEIKSEDLPDVLVGENHLRISGND